MFGAITLRAASDYARGLAELFDSEHPPLYAHMTLAWAALESGVVSAWLNDPYIANLDRIKRGLCEMLYSTLIPVCIGTGGGAGSRELRN